MKAKKYVLDEQISEIHEKITDIEYDLNLTAWKTDYELIKMDVILDGVIFLLFHDRIKEFCFGLCV